MESRLRLVRTLLSVIIVCAALVVTVDSDAGSNEVASLLCVTSDGAAPTKHFGITFDVSHSRWSVQEPGKADVFPTKSGDYVVVANSTSMRRSGDGKVVGLLDNFNPATAADGAQGNGGKALESARIFDWTVAIPHQKK
jgi:hypothetical protein